ncbi:hypothetical protein EHF33_15285 [Deinococcus psychrotolerans]|uniref:Uncharacterized protein n=1 Tax=Deinococcus psychrotolerans TaxID=2489213 RepID=A0A3G8YH04_9DEIO|nr:hypothetical protein [Deinococcus psychrotolerans]AZI44253.1 hypothetical protein EHF33_15285 [Deinococcus psychrotolerans]
MNEIIQAALATAVTAATEALEAAQQDRLTEARQLLTIVDEQLALGEGGNAAATARRKKILRLQTETQVLLDTQAPGETPSSSPHASPHLPSASVRTLGVGYVSRWWH